MLFEVEDETSETPEQIESNEHGQRRDICMPMENQEFHDIGYLKMVGEV